MSQLVPDQMRRLNTRLPQTVKKSMFIVNAMPDSDESLPLLATKVFNILLAISKDDLRRSAIHSVKISDLAILLLEGHESSDRIMQAMGKLTDAKIKISFSDSEGSQHLVRCGILSTNHNVDGGMVRFSFDSILLEFLADPKVYANLRIDVSNQMKSLPSLKIYELMVAYYPRDIPVWSGSVEDLRTFLEMGDVYADRFDHFRTRVLEKAIREVSEYAEFSVEAEYHRGGQGGKVQRITLRAVPKMSGPKTIARSLRKARGGTGRDSLTIDAFRGMSDVDMAAPPPLSDHTLTEARSVAGPDADIDAMVATWFAERGEKAFIQPDNNFLTWVVFQVESTRIDSLKDADLDSIIDDILMN